MAREMLFGLREEFGYFMCGGCGCLQIDTIPADLGRYYPHQYHSFNLSTIKRKEENPLRRRLKNYWKRAYLDRGRWGTLVVRLLGRPGLPEWIVRVGANTETKVLDIGCGDGSRLESLRELGFRHLTGLDRYRDNSNRSMKSLKFVFGDIAELEEQDDRFDLISLHHSLEHMEDQVGVLGRLNSLLTDGGRVVIRIPVVSSYAWRTYGTNWFQLDAPRHLYLHSQGSLHLLAGKAGFEVCDVYCDSNAQGLWASEQYARDISFMDQRSARFGLAGSIFSAEEFQGFHRLARELNENLEGDQACFILTKRA